MKAVVGLFNSEEEAQQAVAALKNRHLGEGQVKICTCKNELCKLLDQYGQGHLVGLSAWFGALLGLVLFGTLGFFAGFVGCRLVGYSASFLCSVIGVHILVGSVFGAILGFMFGRDRWSGELGLYRQAVQAGKQVVIAQVADDHMATKTKELLELKGADGIETLEGLPDKDLDTLARESQQAAQTTVHV